MAGRDCTLAGTHAQESFAWPESFTSASTEVIRPRAAAHQHRTNTADDSKIANVGKRAGDHP